MNIVNSDYKILIVDDIVSNVLLLKVLLTKEGFNVVTAMSGREALEVVERENPSLILLDVMMPDMDGFEVSSRLKATPVYNEIPIIFLTALNGVTDIVKGFQKGGNDFISKPFNKEELIIRVTHQLSMVAAKRIIEEKTEELRRTIMGRDKLYSVIAHDLRGPMGSIKMVLNLMILKLSPASIEEEMYNMLRMANQTTEEVFSLLDNLLKWTKSQIGRLNVVYQDVDLQEVAAGVIEIFSMMARMKEIGIRLISPESAMVYADIDMIKTVLRNLLSNALKFSSVDSEIVVEVVDGDREITVNVIDHGCGISEEDQHKLLHLDTHFSTYGTNNEEGSGLGLLLCQDFIAKNHGRFFFTSVQGKGSTFSFSVPKKEYQNVPDPATLVED
jgi:two-component system sensor histidine kinase/response regulator